MYSILVITSLLINFVVQFSVVTLLGANGISDAIYFGQAISSLIVAIFSNCLGMYLIKQLRVVDESVHIYCLKHVRIKIYLISIILWSFTMVSLYFFFNAKYILLTFIVSLSSFAMISSTISTSYLRYRDKFIGIEVSNIVVSLLYILLIILQSKFSFVNLEVGTFVAIAFLIKFLIYDLILRYFVRTQLILGLPCDFNELSKFTRLFSSDMRMLIISSIYSKSESFVDRFILVLMPVSGLMSIFHLVQQSFKSVTLLYNKVIALPYAIRVCKLSDETSRNVSTTISKLIAYNFIFSSISFLCYLLLKETSIYEMKLNRFEINEFLDLCAIMLPYVFLLLSNQLMSNVHFSMDRARFTAKVGIISQSVNYISKLIFVFYFGFWGLISSILLHNLTTFLLFFFRFKKAVRA